MENLSAEQVSDLFAKRREQVFHYEGTMSLIVTEDFAGLRLDGSEKEFPEDSIFLDEALTRHFRMGRGRWTEPGIGRYRIVVERIDNDGRLT